MQIRHSLAVTVAAVVLAGCERPEMEVDPEAPALVDAAGRLEAYAPVRLTADLSVLSASERAMIPPLVAAAKVMDQLFWYQAYGARDALFEAIPELETRRFAHINYGPWDRLDGNRPFVPGYGPKPPGANFYPPDMTREEFEAWDAPDKAGLYSYVRRGDDGELKLVPYSTMHRLKLREAADHLRAAARHAEYEGLKRYLELRADALLSDRYHESDLAWMDMKDNRIEVVIGPIETYEDRLFGYRAAFEGFVLIKDLEWSERLARFVAFLPGLQRGLPVPDAYKAETPGLDADLNAYDAVYYAGDANAGAKTIAINLPNDEAVQLEKGTRRLQLRNAMRAKFDEILVPITDEVVAADLRRHVTFDAFFSNVMFHEVAHGLGIKNLVDGDGTVREALREHAGALEEAKADVLGLYMITRLIERGELEDSELLDHYVTFMAGLFRSVRFGAASAHGRANMVQFNFFADRGAFARDADGRYHVDAERMQAAVAELAARILVLQGDGDHAGVDALLASHGVIRPELADDLARLAAVGIPVDIVFEQGLEVLGLK